ncbi:hypothetical protein KI387_027257, partial [Taxus chinensis]
MDESLDSWKEEALDFLEVDGLADGSVVKSAAIVGIKELVVEDVATEVVDEVAVEEEVVVVVDALTSIRTSL